MTTKPIVERRKLDKGVKLFQMDKTPTLEACLFEELMGASIVRQLVREFVRAKGRRYDSDLSKLIRGYRKRDEIIKQLRSMMPYDIQTNEMKETKEAEIKAQYAKRNEFGGKITSLFNEWWMNAVWDRAFDEYDAYQEELKKERKSKGRRY